MKKKKIERFSEDGAITDIHFGQNDCSLLIISSVFLRGRVLSNQACVLLVSLNKFLVHCVGK